MFSKSKVKKVDFVTLSKFYGKYKEALQLELINSPAGLTRHICEPALNRPGLAIAGFYSYFANKRIQVFGSAELAYLQKLPEGMRKSRIQRMCRASFFPGTRTLPRRSWNWLTRPGSASSAPAWLP